MVNNLQNQANWNLFSNKYYSPNSFMYSSKFSEVSFSYFLPSQTAAIVYVLSFFFSI